MLPAPIGIFVFGTSPVEHLLPARTRALLAEAALQGAELVFFSAGDCDLRSQTIRGTRWTRSGWKTEAADLPGLVNIVTNPVSGFHREIEAWLRQNAKVVAFRNYDKVELAALIEASPWADYVIPHTTLNPDGLRREMTDWLNAGATVVKPADGMRGGGIHFAVPDDPAWMLSRSDHQWRGSLAETVARIENNIRGRLRYRQYIAQRLIDSRNAYGRAVSIRVDIARTPGGEWSPFSFVARLAGTGKMVSNLKSGGSQQRIHVFLAERRARVAEDIRTEALALAMGVADTLNRNPAAESNFEYGVDILIDQDDRLWFVEANAQPEGEWVEHPRAERVIAYLLSIADR